MSDSCEESAEYNVEKIVGKKKENGKTLYRVRWEGYTPYDDTWEPFEHVKHCGEALLEFKRRRQEDLLLHAALLSDTDATSSDSQNDSMSQKNTPLEENKLSDSNGERASTSTSTHKINVKKGKKARRLVFSSDTDHESNVIDDKKKKMAERVKCHETSQRSANYAEHRPQLQSSKDEKLANKVCTGTKAKTGNLKPVPCVVETAEAGSESVVAKKQTKQCASTVTNLMSDNVSVEKSIPKSRNCSSSDAKNIHTDGQHGANTPSEPSLKSSSVLTDKPKRKRKKRQAKIAKEGKQSVADPAEIQQKMQNVLKNYQIPLVPKKTPTFMKQTKATIGTKLASPPSVVRASSQSFPPEAVSSTGKPSVVNPSAGDLLEKCNSDMASILSPYEKLSIYSTPTGASEVPGLGSRNDTAIPKRGLQAGASGNGAESLQRSGKLPTSRGAQVNVNQPKKWEANRPEAASVSGIGARRASHPPSVQIRDATNDQADTRADERASEVGKSSDASAPDLFPDIAENLRWSPEPDEISSPGPEGGTALGATADLPASVNGHTEGLSTETTSKQATGCLTKIEDTGNLHAHIKNGNYDAVKKWFSQPGNLDVEVAVRGGVTLLMRASIQGYQDIIELLILRGAEVNAQSTEGTTALMFACMNGHYNTVQTLVAFGAYLNLVDNQGDSALIKACRNEALTPAIVYFLLDCGADFSITSAGETAAEIATKLRHMEITDMINNHEKRMKAAYHSAINDVLNNSGKLLEPLFPYRYFALRENTVFEMSFEYKVKSCGRDYGMLLFVAHALINCHEVKCRLWDESAVTSVHLNGVRQPSITKGEHVMSFSPLHNGINNIVLHTEHLPNIDVRLIVGAFKVQVYRKTTK